jgi:hypothetical protein
MHEEKYLQGNVDIEQNEIFCLLLPTFQIFFERESVTESCFKDDLSKHVLVFDTKLCLFQNDFWLAAAVFLTNITTVLGMLCE